MDESRLRVREFFGGDGQGQTIGQPPRVANSSCTCRCEIQDDAEVLMWMESPDRLAAGAAARLRELHPYDVPKIVLIDTTDADADYAAWLESVVRPG